MVSVAGELGGAGEQSGGQAASHRLRVLARAAHRQLRLGTELQQLPTDLRRVRQVPLVQVILPTPFLEGGEMVDHVDLGKGELHRRERTIAKLG